jgi:hypothetical protein
VKLASNKYFCRVINVTGILLGAWTGYSEVAPQKLVNANPDAIFCSTAFVGSLVFVLGWLWIASRYSDSFRRPSFDRFSLILRYDPLQVFFIGNFVLLSTALGATLRWPQPGTVAFYMVVFFWCLFAGWLVGQFTEYVIYRNRIMSA